MCFGGQIVIYIKFCESFDAGFVHLKYVLDHNINNLHPCTSAGLALILIKEMASRNSANKAALCCSRRITLLILLAILLKVFRLRRQIPSVAL
jgi:hypothetical protein